MTADEVQVVRIAPPVGVFMLSGSTNEYHDDMRTHDWIVEFFKTFSGRDDMNPIRLAAATRWRIRPAEPTVEAVLAELKIQAALCGYGTVELFGLTPPPTLFK